MKILMIECTADELSANRTVMDNVNKALNNFTDRLFGVNNINWSSAMSGCSDDDIEHDGCIGCEYQYAEATKFPCNDCKQNFTDRYRFKEGDEK